MRVSNRQNEDECRSSGARDPSMLTQHFMLRYPIPASGLGADVCADCESL